MKKPNEEAREYLATIGKRGGSKKTAAKREAVTANLEAARAKRWPQKASAQ